MIETPATEPKLPSAVCDQGPGRALRSLVGRRLRANGCRLMMRSPKRIEQPLPSRDMSYSRLCPEMTRIEVR